MNRIEEIIKVLQEIEEKLDEEGFSEEDISNFLDEIYDSINGIKEFLKESSESETEEDEEE